MKTFWSHTLGAIVCAAAVGVVVGSVSAQQKPASPSTGPNRIVVIGCIQREGKAPQPNFTITDFRAGSYRLEGDQKLLDVHTGHQVEIAGTVTEGGGSGRSGPARLKVESLLYLSTSCWKTAPR
jgi:hypothetical protein